MRICAGVHTCARRTARGGVDDGTLAGERAVECGSSRYASVVGPVHRTPQLEEEQERDKGHCKQQRQLPLSAQHRSHRRGHRNGIGATMRVIHACALHAARMM